MGEATRKGLVGQNGAIALDTFGGRIHIDEAREGPHQDALPLQRVGRGGTRLGRGHGSADAVGLEPRATGRGAAQNTHRRNTHDREGQRSGAVRLHGE